MAEEEMIETPQKVDGGANGTSATAPQPKQMTILKSGTVELRAYDERWELWFDGVRIIDDLPNSIVRFKKKGARKWRTQIFPSR